MAVLCGIGGTFAVAQVSRATAAPVTATRLNPITVEQVPVQTAAPVATASRTAAVVTDVAPVVSVARPAPVPTRSPARPAPIVPSPR